MKSIFSLSILIFSLLIFTGFDSKLNEAKELAKLGKFNQAITKLGEISHSDSEWQEAQQLIKNYREEENKHLLTKARSMIQGSWGQVGNGMEYNRIIRFDDGIFSTIDGTSNSSYHGTYRVIRATNLTDLFSIDTQCNVRYGDQDFVIQLSIDFDDLNHIYVEGNWAPPSNGSYARINH